MVAIQTILCVLGLAALEGLANPIAYVRRSPDAVAAFGAAQVRRGDGSTGTTTSSAATTSTSAWVYGSTYPAAADLNPSVTTAAPVSAPAATAMSASSCPSFNSGDPFGIAYSPYTSSGGCKALSDIESDIQTIASAGFQIVRLYGVDCNQVSYVVEAISSTGADLKLFLGIFDLSTASSQISTMISAMNGNWESVVTVSIGNEPVNSGTDSVSTVISTTSACRSQLRSAGYNGPVVAVDTFLAILNNPSLCEASDYIAANAHPFFDGTVAVSGAGAWVSLQSSKLASTCSGKDVLITESGWPSEGETNGAAVPSTANQATAHAGILSSMGNKVIMFSAFDDLWKSPGQYDVEQYWGLLN